MQSLLLTVVKWHYAMDEHLTEEVNFSPSQNFRRILSMKRNPHSLILILEISCNLPCENHVTTIIVSATTTPNCHNDLLVIRI